MKMDPIHVPSAKLKDSPIFPSDRAEQLPLRQINRTLANTMWFHNLFVCHVRSKFNSVLIISLSIVKSARKKHNFEIRIKIANVGWWKISSQRNHSYFHQNVTFWIESETIGTATNPVWIERENGSTRFIHSVIRAQRALLLSLSVNGNVMRYTISSSTSRITFAHA